ncbi:hypothetical protein EJ07DRAFT_127733 [Lizonia empirigonia]|nr:hypothetical protein EJ07DRAFT_127733 [Lizonia empirigonia]
MDDLDDELDLRYHRGVKPDVYYRCPNTEARTLSSQSAGTLAKTSSTYPIPSDIATEFVFAVTSTITIPVTLQSNLDALIEPQNFPQSIQVEYALCRDNDSKDRLKIQRAISKSIVAAIEEAEGFKYSERRAYNPKTGGDGASFSYVCQDSLENKDRKANKRKKEETPEDNTESTKLNHHLIPTYDCGGAIHIKFSIKREAINVVYKHNPIHRDVESRQINSDRGGPAANGVSTSQAAKTLNGATQKRKRKKKDHHVTVDSGFDDPDLHMSTSPEASKSSIKKKRKKNGTVASPEVSTKPSAKKNNKTKATAASSPVKSRKQALARAPSPPPRLAKNQACIRCREKKIKCNEATPACNQCKRGLWTCEYAVVGPKQRSKTGCLNCKQRRRKCTEEKPSCAHCLKIDQDCDYAEYS